LAFKSKCTLEGRKRQSKIKNAILKNAAKKIGYFNKIGVHYEAVYHYVIRRREKTTGIWDKDFIDDITAGLISFDMQRMMGKRKYLAEGFNSWASKLETALKTHEKKLENLRSLKLQNIHLKQKDIEKQIITIFDDLSKSGPKGLNHRNTKESFPVGASKILHFIIPDLFIIFDSNAKHSMVRHYNFPRGKVDGYSYLSAMRYYQDELNIWSRQHSDPTYQGLTDLDLSWRKFVGNRTTPIPRIMDKCTFVESLIPG
jgi:hypothetical protein